MGRRNRQRTRAGRGREGAGPGTGERLRAPETAYPDPEHGELVLRGALTPATREQYAAIGGVREDAWQRRVEFLFERLAVRWTVSDVPVSRQREVLARFRAATPAERAWIRDVLREHLAEHFPEMEAP